MLTGRWWLTPAGAIILSNQEHAHYAIKEMLLFPRAVPVQWLHRGVPPEELDAALARGADPEAVEYLRNKAKDPRLFAMQKYGWVRTAKNVFNMWSFDDRTAQIVRGAKEYWASTRYTELERRRLYGRTGDNPHEEQDNPFPPRSKVPAEEVFKKNCGAINAFAAKHALPMPLAKGGSDTLFKAGCDLNKSPWRGAFGVVFPTEKRNVVFKITTDETEAHFVRTAMNLYKKVKPEGIVEYYAIAALPGEHKGYPLFALWREEAEEVGLHCYDSRTFTDFCNLLYEFLLDARAIVEPAYRKQEQGQVKYWAWINEQMEDPYGKVNMALDRLRQKSEDMTNDSAEASYVGEALWTYLKHGLILGDIHKSNVGVVRRGKRRLYVITDPGHVICLKQGLCEAAIETIGRAG